MPLPNNFGATEHFQDVSRKALNKEVKEWFSDVTQDELDVSTPRSSLRTACTHLDSDSILLTVGKMLFFSSLIRGVESGIEYGTGPEKALARRAHPRVVLFFREDSSDVEKGYVPVAGQIGFRMMTETAESISEAELNTLANKIKLEFGKAGGYIWKKGKKMFSYTIWEKGYQLQIQCFSEADGKKLANSIFDLLNHTPDWKYANISTNLEESQAFPTIPAKERILGKNRKTARRRPRADVRFQCAWVEVPGLPNRVYLFDRSGRHPSALVKSY
jgi:hypothetical protein